ncbi:MAG: hypothetical protein LBE59_02580 [Nevskiaceae bacterium]|nr:hypothetical protein [Nevskiaceae bacterium]
MLTVLLASPVNAQSPANRGQNRTDANNDSVISYGEFMAARQQSFARLDRDGDGYMDSRNAGGRRGMRRGGDQGEQQAAPPRMRFDADQDGRVSQQEFVDAGEKQFNSLDADHDGNLTVEERKAAATASARAGRNSTAEERKAARQERSAKRKAAR